MRERSRSIRTRLTALLVVPLLTLVALWGFAVYLTSDNAINLIGFNISEPKVIKPANAVIASLAEERRQSMIYLGSSRRKAADDLKTARQSTDASMARFQQSIDAPDVKFFVRGEAQQAMRTAVDGFRTVAGIRAAVNSASLERIPAMERYAVVIDQELLLMNQLAGVADPHVLEDAKTVVMLYRAREYVARADAVMSGAFAAGTMTVDDRVQFAQNVGASRTLYGVAGDQLTAEQQASYRNMRQGAAYQQVRQFEDTIISKSTTGSAAPVSETSWTASIGNLKAQLDTWQNTVSKTAADHAQPVGLFTLLQLAIAGLAGLIAIILTLVISVRAARGLVRQLRDLRDSANELATVQLPSVVARLRDGESVDTETEAPELEFGSDEIGDVGRSFNAVRKTAVRAAVEQAELRAGVNNVFVNIARRSQSLVHQQLKQLDVMERKSTDAAELEDLFHIDHLSTRMRRNAENLIILGGAAPGRQWRNPVPLVDVLRSAAAEVDSYSRVRVLPVGAGALAGTVVGDATHLLAELIDNAAAFSPPHTPVHVGGQLVPKGFAIEIEDRGLGMTADEFAAANDYLANPPEFNVLGVSDSARLGMFVIARLAARHGIQVSLRGSPYGGTTAIVLVPVGLISVQPEIESSAPEPAGATESKSVVSVTSMGADMRGEQDPYSLDARPDPPIAMRADGPPIDISPPDRVRHPAEVGDDADLPPVAPRRPAAAPESADEPAEAPSVRVRGPVAREAVEDPAETEDELYRRRGGSHRRSALRVKGLVEPDDAPVEATTNAIPVHPANAESPPTHAPEPQPVSDEENSPQPAVTRPVVVRPVVPVAEAEAPAPNNVPTESPRASVASDSPASTGPNTTAGRPGGADLPRRRRHRNLPPQLRGQPVTSGQEQDMTAITARSPEEVRRLMTAYQRGSHAGRAGGAPRNPAPGGTGGSGEGPEGSRSDAPPAARNPAGAGGDE